MRVYEENKLFELAELQRSERTVVDITLAPNYASSNQKAHRYISGSGNYKKTDMYEPWVDDFYPHAHYLVSVISRD